MVLTRQMMNDRSLPYGYAPNFTKRKEGDVLEE